MFKFITLLACAAASAFGGTIRVAWEPVADATEYLVWSGPAAGEYDRATFTTNTTFAVTNLASGQQYRLAVVAYSRNAASLPATLVARPLTARMYLEHSQGTMGPWTVVATNETDAAPGFYRGRVEIR
jgi:hypothetical protein